MYYEVFLNSDTTSEDSWADLIKKLASLHFDFQKWRFLVTRDGYLIHFYVNTPLNLTAPPDLPNFYFVPLKTQTELKPEIIPEPPLKFPRIKSSKPLYWTRPDNLYSLIAYLSARKNAELKAVEIIFYKIFNNLNTTIRIETDKANYRLLNPSAPKLLALDFKNIQGFRYKPTPKFLDSHKLIPYLSNSSKNAVLKLDTFPYSGEKFLSLDRLDLNCHSLVIGASGTGKSKFLSNLVENIVTNSSPSGSPSPTSNLSSVSDPNPTAAETNYKLLIIDPHASLISEIGAFASIIDFETTALNLFDNPIEERLKHKNELPSPTLSTELNLDVFRGLLEGSWNPRLERVLRHSLYLLTVAGELNFKNLRNLLLNLPYRTKLLNVIKNLPKSTTEFFTAEYSEIKNHNYTEAIAPIILLIDEIEMLPVFARQSENQPKVSVSEAIKTSDNQSDPLPTLAETIAKNRLTLISLNRSRLGGHNVKIITSLLISQLFAFIQSSAWNGELICVIDEVAVVANPILENILAEGRKFGLYLTLAGQYFGAIPETLKTAIFANVSNYFVFRVGRDDAEPFAKLLNPKIPLDDSLNQQLKIFTGLNNRECIARVRIDEKLQPAAKATTIDFSPQGISCPLTKSIISIETTKTLEQPKTFTFSIETSYTLLEILPSTAGPRKKTPSLEERLLISLAYYKNHELAPSLN